MSSGDHLYVRRRRRYSRYTHHGIDCGDGTVIHYNGGWGTVRRVERTSWESFADGAPVFVRPHRHALAPEEIVRNAESRLGSRGYHLVRNNCEHFATWSATGSAASRQVRGWAIAGPGAMASIGVAQEAGPHLMLLGTVGMGVAAVTRPLRRRRRGRRRPGGVDAEVARA